MIEISLSFVASRNSQENLILYQIPYLKKKNIRRLTAKWSLLLFNLYVFHIRKNGHKCIRISKFANDVGVFLKSKSANSDIKIIKNAIKITNNNRRNIRLDLKSSQTKFIRSNKKGILPVLNIIQTC